MPAGVTQIHVDAFGAQGGGGFNEVLTVNANNGGLGGQTSVVIAVTPGETLRVRVGGRTIVDLNVRWQKGETLVAGIGQGYPVEQFNYEGIGWHDGFLDATINADLIRVDHVLGWAQQQPIHDTEHHPVRTDAERQDRDHGDREPRRPPHLNQPPRR